MAYSEALAERVREALVPRGDAVTEIKMFGGLCFTLQGNMCVGVVGDDLMVRVGPDDYDGALNRPHVREMDFTGKPMRGLVYVGPDGVSDDDDLESWVRWGVSFASSLPPK